MYKLSTLFSGAGGLDSGFIRTGKFKNQISNDILKAPAETYSMNNDASVLTVDEFNRTPVIPSYIVGDVTNIDFSSLEHMDCVIGGPPCQDFSVSRGNRDTLGIKMVRGNLYEHFIRALNATKPKVFVFENVQGLLSANDGLAYKTIVDDFKKIGSEKEERYFLLFNDMVDSSHIGVPQKRKRLIIIGVRKDLIDVKNDPFIIGYNIQKAKIILTGKDSLLHKYPLCPIEAFEGKPLNMLSKEYKSLMKSYEGILDDIDNETTRKWKKEVYDCLTYDIVKDYLKANKIVPSSETEIIDAFKEHESVLKDLGYDTPLKDQKFKDGSNEIPNENDIVKGRTFHIAPGMNYHFCDGTKWEINSLMSNMYRRLHPLKPAYTLIAYGGGGSEGFHYERDRGKLTHREMARLQTFSDNYMFTGTKSQVRAQIGEAVPVLLGTKLAKITLSVLEKNA